VPLTLGFLDRASLADHHKSHRGEFGWISEEKYAAQADMFLGQPLNPVTQKEGTRKNGDTVRLDMATGEFGVLLKSGYIKTYFRADPRIHRKATNLEYFLECLK